MKKEDFLDILAKTDFYIQVVVFSISVSSKWNFILRFSSGTNQSTKPDYAYHSIQANKLLKTQATGGQFTWLQWLHSEPVQVQKVIPQVSSSVSRIIVFR